MTRSSNEPNLSVAQTVEAHAARVAGHDYFETNVIHSVEAFLELESEEAINQRTIGNRRLFKRRFKFEVLSSAVREKVVTLATTHQLSDALISLLYKTGHLEVTSHDIKVRRIPGLYRWGQIVVGVLTLSCLMPVLKAMSLPSNDYHWLFAISVYPTVWAVLTKVTESRFLTPEREVKKLLPVLK